MIIQGGKSISFSIDNVKRSFFAACNCVFASARYNDQLVHLSLQESYCRPILTYGIVATSLTTDQYRTLNCCWNTVYRKIFSFNKWESVKLFIYGLGRLDFHHIVWLMRANFYKRIGLIASSNCMLKLMFNIYCNSGDNRHSDYSLSLAQLPHGLLKKFLYHDFQSRAGQLIL